MPIYEYRCNDCGHQFEVTQRMSDAPLTECEVCGGHVSKVLFAPAIHFKGSGFHNTDYGTRKRPVGEDGAGAASGSGPGDGAGSNGASGGDAKKAETASSRSGSSSSTKTVGLDKV